METQVRIYSDEAAPGLLSWVVVKELKLSYYIGETL